MKGKVFSARIVLLLVPIIPFVVIAAPSTEIDGRSLVLHRASTLQNTQTANHEVNHSDEHELLLYPVYPHNMDVFNRQKRDFYDRDPWGRMPEDKPYYRRRGYGRRITRYNTRKFSRGRRRKHQGYRGEDYGDNFDESSNKKQYSGYVDVSAFDKQSEPKRNFVSARASGVARTETTGGST